MTPRIRSALLITIALCMTLLSGCATSALEYSELNNTYAIEDVDTIPEQISEPAIKGDPVEAASDLRHEALVDMRSMGGSAEDLARLMTEMFPNEERSVPYYAELAVIDGAEAWIVLEVWGSAGMNLDRTRLWVLDRESGDVLRSTSFN